MSSGETVLGAKVSPVVLQACKMTAANLGFRSTSDWLRALVERAIDPDVMARAQSLFLASDARSNEQPRDEMRDPQLPAEVTEAA